MLIFCGIGEGNEVLWDWHVFSLEKQTWLQLSVINAQGSSGEIPPPRFAASMCAIAAGVAILTGWSATRETGDSELSLIGVCLGGGYLRR